jgi:hypothetical protein
MPLSVSSRKGEVSLVSPTWVCEKSPGVTSFGLGPLYGWLLVPSGDSQ